MHRVTKILVIYILGIFWLFLTIGIHSSFHTNKRNRLGTIDQSPPNSCEKPFVRKIDRSHARGTPRLSGCTAYFYTCLMNRTFNHLRRYMPCGNILAPYLTWDSRNSINTLLHPLHSLVYTLHSSFSLLLSILWIIVLRLELCSKTFKKKALQSQKENLPQEDSRGNHSLSLKFKFKEVAIHISTIPFKKEVLNPLRRLFPSGPSKLT